MLSTQKSHFRNGHCTAPNLVPELCTKHVLVMEWIGGCKITDTEGIMKMGLEPKDVGALLMEVFGCLVFEHGLVHGGNLAISALQV